MNVIVVLKGYKNGIKILMDPDAKFEDIRTELMGRFREAADFFRDASVVLSFEGRTLTADEEISLVNAVKESSAVHVICTAGHDEFTEREYVHALEKISEHSSMVDNAAQIYRGSIASGQTMETENSIVIMGDVAEDASIISNRDIIVMGALYGAAFAGGGGGEHHFIAALDLSPQLMKIGTAVNENKDRPPAKWLRPKAIPRIAYEDAGMIITEPITRELLDGMPK